MQDNPEQHCKESEQVSLILWQGAGTIKGWHNPLWQVNPVQQSELEEHVWLIDLQVIEVFTGGWQVLPRHSNPAQQSELVLHKPLICEHSGAQFCAERQIEPAVPKFLQHPEQHWELLVQILFSWIQEGHSSFVLFMQT